jgi:hypothetical protein
MIKQAIKIRIAHAIETWSFWKFMFAIDKLVFFARLFLLLIYPEILHKYIWKANDTMFIGFAIVNAYAFFDKIVSAMLYIRKQRPKFTIDLSDFQTKKQSINSNGNLIDWISQTDLISFLLKQNWFPFVIAKSKFWMFPKEYKKLGDNLERVWILVRGENNARVLKSKIDREYLEKVITKTNSDDLSLPLLQQWNSFNYQTI